MPIACTRVDALGQILGLINGTEAFQVPWNGSWLPDACPVARCMAVKLHQHQPARDLAETARSHQFMSEKSGEPMKMTVHAEKKDPAPPAAASMLPD